MTEPPITVVVADDEPVIRTGICELLAEDAGYRVVAECGDGRSAVEHIERHRPRVAFLDVRMPELNGFEILEALEPEVRPHVVFVTAYDEYALQAFDVHAVDYLLKPFDRDRFVETLRRVALRLESEAAVRADVNAAWDALPGPWRRIDRIAVRTAGRIQLIDANDVERFEAAGNYVRVYVGERGWPVRHTIKGLASRLDPSRFVRVHRSTIVNLASVVELEALPTGDFRIRLASGADATLSRTYRSAFQDRIGWKI